MSGLTCRPVCAVHDAFLEERVVDAHDDAAGHLRLAALHVDDQAAVLHRDDLRAADHAGLGIDQHLGHLHAADVDVGQRLDGLPSVASLVPLPLPTAVLHAEPGAGLLPGVLLVGPLIDHLARLDGQVFLLGLEASWRSCRTGRRARPVAAVVEPPAPCRGRSCCRRSRPTGRSGSRRCWTVMSFGSSPSISATTMAITVRSPVPRSCVEDSTSTLPSLLMVTVTSLGRLAGRPRCAGPCRCRA